MNFDGNIIGAIAFTSIAFCRYITIKGEYYFSKKLWIAFLVLGIALIAASLFVGNNILSVSLGILAFNFLWGIGEVIEQHQRVQKGWFPKNPKRNYK